MLARWTRANRLTTADFPGDWSETFVYLGNLLADEPQFQDSTCVGLALHPRHAREFRQDLLEPLAIPDNCVRRVQAQDVLEHLDKSLVAGLLSEVFRIMAPDGVFRVSVPDYLSPVQRERSVFDEEGNVLADLMVGGSVHWDEVGGRTASFDGSGDAHVWFPTYAEVMEIVELSDLRLCREMRAYQYFSSVEHYVCLPIPDIGMPVWRSVPLDLRGGGKPISIVIDFIK